MGSDEERSRALEFLQGDPEDLEEVLGTALDLYRPRRRDDHPFDEPRTADVEDRRVFVGCCLPARDCGLLSYSLPGTFLFACCLPTLEVPS